VEERFTNEQGLKDFPVIFHTRAGEVFEKGKPSTTNEVSGVTSPKDLNATVIASARQVGVDIRSQLAALGVPNIQRSELRQPSDDFVMAELVELADGEGEGTWVTEEVLISLSLGKLHLKNMNSSHGYNYTGYGSIIERVHITGNWESVRPGANAYGAFMLTISSQGDFLYGYWVGADKVGAQRYGRWVLARNWGSIEEAKALLEKMRHPIAPT